MKLLLLSLLLSTQAHSALVCKSNAFTMDHIYTFTAAENNNLNVVVDVKLDDEMVSDFKSVAVHTSTLKLDFLGMKDDSESYYFIASSKDSYTELISIDADRKSMARSRPMYGSATGNFAEFKCTGKI